MLMKDSGQFVKANFGSSFMQSLLNDELTLDAGNYCLMVDPIWNPIAQKDPRNFKKVLLDIYGPE